MSFKLSMTSIRPLLVCVLLSVVLLAPALAGSPVQVEVLSDDGQRIILRYRMEGTHSLPVIIEGQEYEKIWFDSEPVLHVKGAPALPQVNRSVIVPGDARMDLRVLSVSFHDQLTRIAPSKGHLSRKIDPALVPYQFGDAYSVDALMPPSLAGLREPYIMRDHRGIVVELTPFQYNAITGVLRVYTEVVVEVYSAGPGKINLLEPDTARAPVRPFEEIYNTHFLNAAGHGGREEGLDYSPIDEEGEMLIICHDAWMDNMTALINHKNSIGITTSIVKVSEVGNDAASIKSYIQNRYDTSDLAFVLLVGDSAQVATPIVNVGGENGAADPTYAKLAGGDDYPEILVGRFSAQTAAQVDTQVERTIDYENLPATGEAWFKRGTGIASNEGGGGQGDEGQSDIEHQTEIRDWLLGDGYAEVDQIYDPGATDDEVHDALNAGRGIVNYTGHGSATSWSTTGFNVSDVNALVNDEMLPFIVSVACNNGEFHHYDNCFGEAWLRATHDGVATGAIGVYASSVSQAWSPPMEGQDEFNLLLTDPARPYSSYGALCFAGSSSMMDDYGTSGREMFDTWIIFGDPSLQVVGAATPASGLRVTPAAGLVSSGNAGGPYSPASIEYTLENLDESPMDYEITWFASWISVSPASGTLSAGGTQAVSVVLNDLSRNLDHGSYQDTVTISNLTSGEGDTTRSVSLTVGGEMIVKRWLFDQNPGWNTSGEWAFGTPTGQGGGYVSNPDPTEGATGSLVYGVNLDGNFSGAAGGPYYLEAGPIDLSSVSGAQLVFQRWLNTAGLPYVRSTVEVSADGIDWTQIWTTTEEVTDPEWIAQSFDISSVVDNQPAVYLRWSYSVETAAPLVGSGWNLDDVEIRGMAGSARITLLLDTDRAHWNPVAGALTYDLLRGDVATLTDTAGDFSAATEECVANDLGDQEHPYTDLPAPGSSLWLLVRGTTVEGPMTWQPLAGESQVGTRDEEINAAAGSCP